jgi:hypothetical protein
MADQRPITIPLDFPSSDEVVALAQFVKRLDYETVVRFCDRKVLYGGRPEGDVAWSAICDVQRQLAEAGFAPR